MADHHALRLASLQLNRSGRLLTPRRMNRVSAANQARSPGSYRIRPAFRRSTAFSCRSTSNSAFFSLSSWITRIARLNNQRISRQAILSSTWSANHHCTSLAGKTAGQRHDRVSGGTRPRPPPPSPPRQPRTPRPPSPTATPASPATRLPSTPEPTPRPSPNGPDRSKPNALQHSPAMSARPATSLAAGYRGRHPRSYCRPRQPARRHPRRRARRESSHLRPAQPQGHLQARREKQKSGPKSPSARRII